MKVRPGPTLPSSGTPTGQTAVTVPRSTNTLGVPSASVAASSSLVRLGASTASRGGPCPSRHVVTATLEQHPKLCGSHPEGLVQSENTTPTATRPASSSDMEPTPPPNQPGTWTDSGGPTVPVRAR